MRVGIVVPARNAAAFIGTALHSVVAQSHADWSMVVVDDGSTDDSATIAAGFRDSRIRLIRQPAVGVSAARNAGLAHTDAEAVLFLDADDWLAPDGLARLVGALAAAAAAVAAVGPHAFVTATAVPGDPPLPRRAAPPRGGDLFRRLLTRNLFANGGHLLIRRGACTLAGGFNTALRFGEDWEFLVRIAALGPFVAAPGPNPVLFVRAHPAGAYRRLATDLAAHQACLAAIFALPELRARFSPLHRAMLRRQANAEVRWIIGREMIRAGDARAGLPWLRDAVRRRPTPKRAALLAAAHLLSLLPERLHGPFQTYDY